MLLKLFFGDNIQLLLFGRQYTDAFFGRQYTDAFLETIFRCFFWRLYTAASLGSDAFWETIYSCFFGLYTAASLETFSAAGAFWRREAEAGMEKIRHTISPLNHKLQNPKPSTLHSSEHTNPNPQTQCRPINPEPQNPKSSSPKGPKALNLSVSLDPRALGFKVLGFRALGFRALGLRAL